MSEHVIAQGPTRDDGEARSSEPQSTSDTAQAATSAVDAAPRKPDQDISGLAVVADSHHSRPAGIQQAGHGPSIFGIVVPAHSAGHDSKTEGFFSVQPTADVRVGGNASVLSPSDVQRNKLLALHGKGKWDSRMNLLKHDIQMNPLQDSDRAGNSVPTSYGAAEEKSSVKIGPNKRRGGTLSVEIRESTDETLRGRTLSNKPPNTAGARRARAARARASVEEIMKDVPLGTVLSINKLVIKAQARIRGVISRRVMTRYMKRHSGGLRGTDLTASSNLRPDEDEIVTFCDHTQVSANSCRLTSLAFVDGKVRMSDTVAGSRRERGLRHETNFQPSKVAPLPSSASASRRARQEEDQEEEEGPVMGAQGLGVGAGYFQFNAIGIEFGSGCVSRYLCLDMGTPDVKTAEDASLQDSAIPTAFLHLKMRCKNLKNMDGLLGKSDPFFTISRIDDPGSLDENTVKVYTSPVITDDLNPRWPKVRIPLQQLTSRLHSDHCVLLFEVWDQDRFTAHDRIGIARCSLRDIQTGLEVPLMADEQNHCAPNGVLIFETCRMELKYYKFGGMANPALIRFYAEHVWNLPKPEVLISITSGLSEYNLESSIEDSILYDMMEMCNNLNAWVITNGSATGFAKRVGEYRAKFAVTTPLIGICITPEGKIADATTPRNGHEGFSKHSVRDLSRDHSRSNTSMQGSPEWMAHIDESLDRNHSHFILCHNAAMGGRALTKMRTGFEACMGQNSSWPPINRYISQTMLEHNIDWPDADYTRAPTLAKAVNIPVVKVCVQGGAGAIHTILNAVNDQIPVLLVRGTGKAADLIADCVCLKFPIGHAKHLERTRLDHRQKILYDCLENLRVLASKRLQKMSFYSKLDFYHKDQAHPWKNREKNEIKDMQLEDPSGHGYFPVIQLLKHVSLLDEATKIEIQYRAAKVMTAYDVSRSGSHLDDISRDRTLLIQVLLAARSKSCWVYDLDVNKANFRKHVDEERVNAGLQRPTDFKGSLLHCLLNSLQHSREEQFNILRTQVHLAIKWKRPDALHWLLRKSSTIMQRYSFQELIDNVLQTAVATHNEEAVIKLVEYGANLSAYKFSLQADETATQTEEGWMRSKMAAEKKLQQAALLWENLMVSCKTDPSTRHVRDLLKLIKTRFRDRARLTGATSRATDEQSVVDASDLSRLVGWEAFNNLEWQTVVTQMENRGKELDEDDVEEIKQRCKTWQRIVLLQSLYQDLLGKQFRYFFGILDSPNFDLFLWFVLSNRPNMAMIFWHFCKQPMLTAIVGAYLCRKMATHHTSKHAAYAEDLMTSAKTFEELAIQVCKSAFLDDRYRAMAALEQPLPLWPGLKLMDLAFHAKCLDFISKCCSRGIDRRWAGDLMDTDHTYAFPGGFRLVLSVDWSVLAQIVFFGFGLLSPLLLPSQAWQAPPKHQNFRYSTQRRDIPQGYPYEPLTNRTMQHVLGLDIAEDNGPNDQPSSEIQTPSAWRRKMLKEAARSWKSKTGSSGPGTWSSIFLGNDSKDRHRVEILTAQLIEKLKSDRFGDGSLLNQLWEPTFGYWERLKCFYRAPVTLFWLTSLYQIMVASCGIWYLSNLQDAVFKTTHVASGLGNTTHYDRVSNLSQDATYDMNGAFKEGSPTEWIQTMLTIHHVCQLVLSLALLSLVKVRGLGLRLFNTLGGVGSCCWLAAYGLKHRPATMFWDSTDFYVLVRSHVLNPEAFESLWFPVFGNRPGVVFLLEGLSIGLSIFNLLSVICQFKSFAKFVLTFFSMFSAISHGLVVWFVLHWVFVFFRIGLTMLCQTYPDYLLNGATIGDGVTCSDNPLNAFALLFNSVSDWDYAGQMTELWLLYALVFWVVQVVLMNFFIALMSSKFSECMNKAEDTFVITRFELAQTYSCLSLVFLGSIAALPLFILDLLLFCLHYRGLNWLYPSCTTRALLLLHLTRSNAHRDDKTFSWFRGVISRVDVGDASEVQQLHCFLENARRHFMHSHFPGKRFITLQAVGALNDYAGHASLQLELKMQAAQDTIKGAMEEMRNHHDAIYANQAKIARAQEDGRIHREAIEKLSQHAGIRVLPGQAADWSQQAAALDTRGFAMANTAGGFGNLVKTTKPGGVGVSGGGGAGGGFAQTLGQHGGFGSGSKPGFISTGGGFEGGGGGKRAGVDASAPSTAADEPEFDRNAR